MLGYPEDILRRELLQVLINIGLPTGEEYTKLNEFRNGTVQWMTVHCLYLDFHQHYAEYCDEKWAESDNNAEYQECCKILGSPLTEDLISLEQMEQREQQKQ